MDAASCEVEGIGAGREGHEGREQGDSVRGDTGEGRDGGARVVGGACEDVGSTEEVEGVYRNPEPWEEERVAQDVTSSGGHTPPLPHHHHLVVLRRDLIPHPVLLHHLLLLVIVVAVCGVEGEGRGVARGRRDGAR